MVRIVLDTNVIVAGLRSSRGASSAVLRLVGTGAFEVVLSVALALEYEAVIARHRSASVAADVVDYLCSVADRTVVHFRWRPTLRDPGDDMVLELAVAGAADAIVTFNARDFGPAARFGVRILSPADLLKEVAPWEP